MQVQEIMTRRPELVNRHATARDAARKMQALDIGALPVVDRGHLVGMLTDRDLALRCVAAGLDPLTTPVEALMTPDVVTCRDDDGVHELATIMEAHSLRRIVVVNGRGKPVGIVTVSDLARRAPEKQLVAEALQGVTAH
jgi:CBS domain-containing protein